jgi:hypothetical protein
LFSPVVSPYKSFSSVERNLEELMGLKGTFRKIYENAGMNFETFSPSPPVDR